MMMAMFPIMLKLNKLFIIMEFVAHMYKYEEAFQSFGIKEGTLQK